MLGADVLAPEAQRLPERELEGLGGLRVERDQRRAPAPTGGAASRRRARTASGDPLGGDRGRPRCSRARRAGRGPGGPARSSSLPAALASSCAADDDVPARGGEAGEALAGVEAGGSPLATNRFWAACLVTPMLRPISVHEAPERRAWSTKWPIRWSATSPRCSAGEHGAGSWSRASVWAPDRLDEVVEPDGGGHGVVMRQP